MLTDADDEDEKRIHDAEEGRQQEEGPNTQEDGQEEVEQKLQDVDPWVIARPTVLAVSGGRTSMYMLWRYLQRHGGKLPDIAIPVFCNTGKEHPKTLDFVQRCSVEWVCPIVWLEYRSKARFEIVNHNSASRCGEPFHELIGDKKALPNQVMRFCTEELKIFTLHRWAIEHWPWGGTRYTKAIGYRVDDDARVRLAKMRCGARPDPWETVWPLYTEGVMTKAKILAHWSRQSFDLEAPPDEGNCDLCFLKHTWKRATVIERDPSKADWWIAQQERTKRFFRSPRRRFHDYRQIRHWALSNMPKPWKQGTLFDDDILSIECTCTD